MDVVAIPARMILNGFTDTKPMVRPASPLILRNTVMAKRRSTEVPSVEEYKRALQGIEATLPKAHRAMLVANYNSKARTITTKELAKAVGFRNYNAAVLQYGRLGHRLCELLRYTPTMRMSNGNEVWTSVLADAPPEGPADEWEWSLRPEVAQAMEELG